MNKIACVLTCEFDLYPKPGAVGNKWDGHQACYVYYGDVLKTIEAANDKLREIANHPNTKKILTWQIVSNENNTINVIELDN